MVKCFLWETFVHVRTASKKMSVLQILFALKTLLAQFIAWVSAIKCMREESIIKGSLVTMLNIALHHSKSCFSFLV